MSEYKTDILNLGFIVVLFGTMGYLFGANGLNTIPTLKAKNGYVQPSELEIKLQDLNEDGENETVFEYRGKSYLALDDNGKLKVMRYNLTPREIIPPKIIYREEGK